MKKYSKILLTILCAFFISFMSVGAKELTLDELAKLVKEQNPNATYVYIIGEYAYTSDHVLTTQDTMLAARSIKATEDGEKTNRDKIYEEMTIAYYEGVYDSNWELVGLKFVKNVVGNTNPKDVYEIKYLDYDKKYTEIDVDALVEKAYNTIKNQAPETKFKVSKDENKINVILKDLSMSSIEALAGTGVATAAAEFLNEEGIEAVTLTIGDATLTVGEELNQAEIDAFFKALGETASDLSGKQMTAKVVFEDGYKSANSDEFVVDFGKTIDVEALVKKAYDTIKNQAATNKFIPELKNNIIEITVVDENMDSIQALAGTGIATAAGNLLNEEGIKVVHLVLNDGEQLVKLEVGADLNQTEIDAFFKALGNTSKDLIGKTLFVTIELKDNYETNTANKFDIVFKESTKVDVEALVEKAYNTINKQAPKDKFIVNLSGNGIELKIMDLEMASIEALAGTGVATAAGEFLKEEGIKAVTLTINGATLTVGEELNQEEINAFFQALGTNAKDLLDKIMTAKVVFNDGYKTANSDEFTIKFVDATRIDVDALVEKAYNTIKNQAGIDKFEVSKNANDINVLIKKLDMDSIEALAGTGVATAAGNFLNEAGIKAVTLTIDGATLTVGEELNQAEINAFFQALGTTAADLADKTITAKVVFEDGYKSANSDEFNINFGKLVDVESLVDEAFNTIKNQAPATKFEVSKTGEEITVLIKDLTMDSIEALAGTGVATAAGNFLNEAGIKSVTLSLGENSITIGEDLNQTAINNFFKALGTTAADLVDKEMTAVVSFKDCFKALNKDTFTIKFTKDVNIESLVDTAFNTIKNQAPATKFEVSKAGEEITVLIKDLTMDSIEALAGTGVATAASNFLNEAGIESVILSLGENSITIGEDLNQTAIETFFKALGSKAADLVDKEITAEVALKDGYKVVGGNTFKIKFTKMVDVDSLVKEAYELIEKQAPKNKFLVSLNGNVVEVVVMDKTMDSIEALAGTGIATAAGNFLNETGIKSVKLSLGEVEVTVGDDLNQTEIENFFKSLGNKAGDLINKTIKAEILFEDGYKSANGVSFDVAFNDSIKVNVESLVDEAFNTIKNQAPASKFEVSKAGEKITVLIKDLTMDSIDALAGTGVATAAGNFLNENGIKSVTLRLGENSVTIGDELNRAAIENFFKALGNKAGDLVDKEITAEIAFDDGYEALNGKVFKVKFTKDVNIESLVDEAFNTIKNQAPATKFEVSKTGEEITVLIKDLTMDSIEALAGTGVATAAGNFLNEKGIATVKLSLGNAQVTIGADLNQTAIEDFFKALGNKAADLVDKTITAEVTLKDGYKAVLGSTFKIKFTKLVDVNSLVDTAFNTIKNQAPTTDFEVNKDGNKITISIKNGELDSIEALAGTGVATAAGNFLNEAGIKSVKLSLGEANVTIGADLNQAEITTFLSNLGTKSAEFVGKTIKAEILFEDGYKTLNAAAFDIVFEKAPSVTF